MKGAQKHGGGCEGGAVGHSEHVAAGTVRHITRKHSVDSTPPPQVKKKTKKKALKTKQQPRREAEMGGECMG